MLGFLQGFSYGLFLSCLPWFTIGMIDPRVAVASEPPSRWRVIVRYVFVLPFLAVSLWLTSLWGGFHPSFVGWVAGLAAIAFEIPAERAWRRWEAKRLSRRRRAIDNAEAARDQGHARRTACEAGTVELDPAAPPTGADDVVLALCRAKQRLQDARRDDLAAQADRVYTRYQRVLDTLRDKFDERELTFGRSSQMVAEVCLAAADHMTAMASVATGVLGIDTAYIRRRLADTGLSLHADERDALRQRLALAADSERRVAELAACNESAMTTLDQAAVVMAQVHTDRPRARAGAEQALGELQSFLDRADRYARPS